jgi:phosphatidylserine decarboxylase
MAGERSLLTHPLFFRLYRYAPQRWLNRMMGLIGRARWPRPLLRAMIARWVARAGIAMDDVVTEDWPTLERWFLRRLVPGARPLGEGIVAPADGVLVAAGAVDGGTLLQIKGSPYSLDALINGGSGATTEPLSLAPYEGGRFATIFLTPNGYHYVHTPLAAQLEDVRWHGGRFYPQNPSALRHIEGIYPRNERAVLRLRTDDGQQALLVLVGASLIGGIELTGLERDHWAERPEAVTLGRSVARGEELGWFTFGSTVVLVLPRTLSEGLSSIVPAVGAELALGQTLYRFEERTQAR